MMLTGRPTKTDSSYELMRMIESVRHSVGEWRRLPRAQWRVTPETGRLFDHWSAFSVGDRQAIEKKEPTHSKVLLLLSDACSLVLSPQSRNEPFKPFSVMNGRRSAIPDDFSASEIDLFAQVVDAVDDPRLKARLADLVWLSKTPRDHQFALSAVDAYRLVPIDKDTWGSRWTRMLGKGHWIGAYAR